MQRDDEGSDQAAGGSAVSGDESRPSGEDGKPRLPSLSLPKGGGAIRGIGEKFGTNPVTGTASLTIPLPVSPGRAGFAPQLGLSYDSGSGNGPFGFGWSLGLPSITRKTDKGLPRYRDAEESDVFLVAGAEDLVPWLLPSGLRHEDQVTVPGFTIHRYRPRVEGAFTRIERWTEDASGHAHWRTITRENVTTIYGRDGDSCIFDPADATRIFTWLICESYDDRGNALVYEYVPEDGANVDLTRANERNRTRDANRYLKRVRYGNRVSRLIEPDLSDAEWLFELVLDYGEGHYEPLPPDADGQQFVQASATPAHPWAARSDPFSSYRSGFEVRTHRLCRRALMFHRFDELGEAARLVSGLLFDHDDAEGFSFLRAVTSTGYVLDETKPALTYLEKSVPPLELEYSRAVIQDEVRELDRSSVENLPIGVDAKNYLFVDLDGEGIAGILTEQAGAWFYKPNLGDGRFGPIRKVASLPSTASLGDGQQLLDLDGDGRLELVALSGPVPGFFERTDDEGWDSYRAFRSLPNVQWDDPNLRFVDLDGDGHADVLITEDDLFTWYESLEQEGFGAAKPVRPPRDDDHAARLLFADGTQSVYLADMSGDGLTDLVRVRNGEVCYWPNLGYGRFGAKVTMDDAPWLDHPDQFDQRRVRVADIDGSGANDLIYLGRHDVRVYFNRSGNSWSAGQTLNAFPHVDDLSAVTTADLLGNGTACLVWSSPLANDDDQPLRYVDLMGGQKPHLFIASRNNLGAETRVRYASSTKFYLDDKRAGRPWITRLAFPVHVVERVETFDRIGRNRFVSRYAYHHGYFDGDEREFRGFACVEQFDTEEFATLNEDTAFPSAVNIDAASHVPPVLTKTWFHTGSRVARDLSREFYGEPALDDTVLPPGLTNEEEREACRALKGSTLRTEMYALDGTAKAAHPYSVAEQNQSVRRVQPHGPNRHAVFLTMPRESVTFHYERAQPPDPRVAHSFTIEVDDFGNVLRSASVAYGRAKEDGTLPTQADRERQTELHITCSVNAFTNPIDTATDYRTPQPSEAQLFELTGLALAPGSERFTFEQIDTASGGGATLRLLKHARTRYRRDDLDGPLDLHVLEPRALPFESYKLAFTPERIADVYDTRVDGALLEDEGRYTAMDGRWWVPSARLFYSPDTADTPAQELAFAQEHFFVARRLRDPFQNEGTVDYDDYDLLPEESQDAIGNTMSVQNDYRILQPVVLTDANGNRNAVAVDALGMVVGTAAMGKEPPALAEGDSLAGFVADLTRAEIAAHFADPFADAAALLQGAGTRLVYDAFAYFRTRNDPDPQPTAVATLARDTHAGDPLPAEGLRIQHTVTYFDGAGREAQKKLQTEASADMNPRWIGSGWTIFNNKGKPVRAYEPFFTATHAYELAVQVGVSAITFYDPAQRVAGTLHPDHTWEKVVFDPWRKETWDGNDTVLLDPAADPDVGGHFARLRTEDYLPTWHAQRAGGALGASEQAAANKTAIHAATPGVAHFDSLGRSFLSIARNRLKYTNTPPLDPPVEEQYTRRVTYDVEGKEVDVFDANGRLAMHYEYDLVGTRLFGANMEAGDRWTLNDVAGKAIRQWDTIGRITRTEYDALRRPLRTFVLGANPDDPAAELLTDRVVYGESHPDPEPLNLRGQTLLLFDQAGVARNEEYDFKNNLLRSSRRIAREFEDVLDWSAVDADPLNTPLDPFVEAETYTNESAYNARNKVIEQLSPDGTVLHLRYNEEDRLRTVHANLRGSGAETPFVTDLDYDAKGQRTRIVYGNGAETAYEYDPLTFRLRRLHTAGDGGNLQDLRYTYDPAGNITHIRDDAQHTIYFRNHHIDPSAEYTYDALYHLIEATGREHLGQLGGAPIPHSPDDAPRVGIHWDDNDGNAMGAYLERYLYDPAGNILEMQHVGSDPVSPGWTRTYEYAEPNNRLTSTTVGANPVERYVYDAHGNMIRMPHFGGAHPDPNMRWDYRDSLHEIDLGGGGVVDYVYDSSGHRTRKVWRKTPGLTEERIYLGGFEVFRRRNGGGAVTLERETLHIMDDTRRIAIVETRTIDTAGDDPAPEQLIRYQFANHLGSSTLELDQAGDIISYEEYTPYGSTAYEAVRSQTGTPKRYRYSGVERDEESGLGHHGARYYAPWLGRWTATDPAGLVDGENLYRYSRDNPIVFNDPSGLDPPPLTPLSQGEFRLQLAHPVNDPLAHASLADLAMPGLVGLGFNALDAGTRITSDPWGRRAINLLELGVTFVGMYGPMVYSHEWGGHVGTAERYGASSSVSTFRWWGGSSAAPTPAGFLSADQQTSVTTGGNNQQNLNALATYQRTATFGYMTFQDAIWMGLGVGGVFGYGLVTVLGQRRADNDLINYAAGAVPGGPERWQPNQVFGVAALTAAPTFGLAIASAYRFVVDNRRSIEFPSLHFGQSGRLTFPMFNTWLTSQGAIVSGTTVMAFGRGQPSFQFGLDVRPTSDFAMGFSVRSAGLRIPGSPIEVNPHVRFTAAASPGIWGGAQLGIRGPFFSVNTYLEAGVNDIRREPEGLPLPLQESSQAGGRVRSDISFWW